MTTQDDRYLPGSPSKRLIVSVRRALKGYGIRPHDLRLWCDVWQWAQAIKYSYFCPAWPSASEIAAMYVTLLLADMRTHFGFKLPHRASEKQTDAVKARLSAGAARALPGVTSGANAAPQLLPPAEAST